jgi:hypothetical protein
VVINKVAYYWRFLELGWKTKGGFHIHPFIGRAFERAQEQAAQAVIDECEAQVKKAQQKVLVAAAGGF